MSSIRPPLIFIAPQNKCFRRYTGISLSVHVSVCVRNTSFCQRGGGGMKSQLVTALSFVCNRFQFRQIYNFLLRWRVSVDLFCFRAWGSQHYFFQPLRSGLLYTVSIRTFIQGMASANVSDRALTGRSLTGLCLSTVYQAPLWKFHFH